MVEIAGVVGNQDKRSLRRDVLKPLDRADVFPEDPRCKVKGDEPDEAFCVHTNTPRTVCAPARSRKVARASNTLRAMCAQRFRLSPRFSSPTTVTLPRLVAAVMSTGSTRAGRSFSLRSIFLLIVGSCPRALGRRVGQVPPVYSIVIRSNFPIISSNLQNFFSDRSVNSPEPTRGQLGRTVGTGREQWSRGAGKHAPNVGGARQRRAVRVSGQCALRNSIGPRARHVLRCVASCDVRSGLDSVSADNRGSILFPCRGQQS